MQSCQPASCVDVATIDCTPVVVHVRKRSNSKSMNQRIMKTLVMAPCARLRSSEAASRAGDRHVAHSTLTRVPHDERLHEGYSFERRVPNPRAPTRATLDSKLAVKPAAVWLDRGHDVDYCLVRTGFKPAMVGRHHMLKANDPTLCVEEIDDSVAVRLER